MTGDVKHISVCISTFKRRCFLRRLLKEVDRQVTKGLFTYSVVVADNDTGQSAKCVVSEFSSNSLINTKYCVEPRQNIALARNKTLENAKGDFIAFIDDDEYPTTNWLCSLFETCNESGVDGVFGPVIPYFEQEPPKWVTRGRLFSRPTHETGYRVGLAEARTGNVMFKREILEGSVEVFREEFGMGGEDVDFFRRMIDKGRIFIWSNEAVVYEAVPPDRCNRRYLLRRALLRGKNTFRQPTGRVSNLFKSSLAIPVYGLALPFLFLAGDHHFMKYLIKFCDHGGRILAMFGCNPVNERNP